MPVPRTTAYSVRSVRSPVRLAVRSTSWRSRSCSSSHGSTSCSRARPPRRAWPRTWERSMSRSIARPAPGSQRSPRCRSVTGRRAARSPGAERLLRQAPRRKATIRARAVEAEAVARGIANVRLTPEPVLIARLGLEDEAVRLEGTHPLIQVLQLEIDDRSRCGLDPIGEMEREGRIPRRAFETGVPRGVVDDESQAEPSVEIDRRGQVHTRHGDLVQVHLSGSHSRCRKYARQAAGIAGWSLARSSSD